MAEKTPESRDAPSLSNLLRETLRCFLLLFAVAVLGVMLQSVFAEATLKQLEQLRHFTPLTMDNLLRDSLIDCVYDHPQNPLSFPCCTEPVLAD
jgi:hypothetical protein